MSIITRINKLSNVVNICAMFPGKIMNFRDIHSFSFSHYVF